MCDLEVPGFLQDAGDNDIHRGQTGAGAACVNKRAAIRDLAKGMSREEMSEFLKEVPTELIFARLEEEVEIAHKFQSAIKDALKLI